VEKLWQRSRFIYTHTLVTRANRTLSHFQNTVMLAGIRSRLFMHYRSSSGSGWFLLLTRKKHSLLAVLITVNSLLTGLLVLGNVPDFPDR